MPVSVFIAPTCSPELASFLAERLVDEDERRTKDISSDKRRSEFVSGRLLARQSLAEAYGERSREWALETQPSGALSLKPEPGLTMPAISLSHSHGRVACGLAVTPAFGLDIERVRPRANIAELASQILHPDEMQQFSRLDANGRTHFFYAKWVLKEALGKALGYGINYPMHEVVLSSDSVLDAPQAWVSNASRWIFSHTLLDGGYALGLAWEGDAADHVSIKTVEIRT